MLTQTPHVDVSAATIARRPHLRGWSHVVAAVVAIVLCPIAIVNAGEHTATVSIFSATAIGLFAVSAFYHRAMWGTRAHEVFRRLDHSMIFVAIAGTYTPVAVAALSGSTRLVLMSFVWGGAVVGVFIQSAWAAPPRWLTVGSYAALGWCILPLIHHVWHLGVGFFVLLLVGGITHTIGAVVYATQRPNPIPTWFGFHEIFHLLVIAAVASHYVAIAVLL